MDELKALKAEIKALRSERTAWRVTAENAEAEQSLPDGWVMLDKNGVVHRYKWKRIDFFGSVDDSGTAFTLGEIEYEAREWAGLAPFTVRPVSFMAPVLRHWPMEEQPDGTVIPVDPSELIAASTAQPVQPSAQAVWNSPEETASAPGLVWLSENGAVFLGYHFEQPFREYRDNDGFYVGQQDAESYWARHEDAEPCNPDGWCRLIPPLPPAPQPKD